MKNKIIEKSVELFEKNGFTETSIQHIVDALHVTKGTFYYYYQSKEQLLCDIHIQYIDDLLERQERVISEGQTAKEKLYNIIKLLIEDIEDKGQSALVFFREIRHLLKENEEIIKEKRDMFRLNIENIIRMGVENGEFQDNIQPNIVAFALLGMTNYSYNWYNPMGPVTPQELVEQYYNIFMNGLLKGK